MNRQEVMNALSLVFKPRQSGCPASLPAEWVQPSVLFARVLSPMKFKPSRKFIGVATAIAVTLFITNPELYALSFLIGSIGFDVFLLFLTLQFRDQLSYVGNLVSLLLRQHIPVHQERTRETIKATTDQPER